MKLKLYYGAVVLLWLLTGCSNPETTVTDFKFHSLTGNVYPTTIDGHLYYVSSYNLVHSGSCPQCKHELDSIVRVAVAEALEDTAEEWNE